MGRYGGGAGGGPLRGSAIRVMAWHTAHRIEVAPLGSWSGVRQLEQLTSINILALIN